MLGGAARAEEPAAGGPLQAAQKLLAEGKYAEATEAYERLLDQHGPATAIGLARSQEATGQRAKAAETIATSAKKHADAAALPAELARLALARGDTKAAAEFADAALKLDAALPLAIWAQAEVLTATGKLTEANAASQVLVDHYNANPPKDAESLRWIGLAAAQYARWNRLSDQFSFLVNEFYPDLLAADPTCWQAHYEAGRLFAEKYNQADALREFNAAIELNPNAAEVHAALGQLSLDGFEIAAAQASAERAREINPELLAARHLQADIHLANFDPRSAAAVLTEALPLDPPSEETRGRLAAVYFSVDGVAKTGDDTRFGKLAAEVNARNPHAGGFYESLGDALDRLRRWPAAAKYYEEAIARMPQLVRPRCQLGLMLMRLGEEERAKQVLDDAFEVDPFNVRVNNSLKVLEVLAGYETLETEHFRIRFDPQQDALTPKYMGQWLEEVYPQLVRQMGFTPPEKSLFEVFSSARNTDGHGWFSARMVGLPHIHPIGACAGKIVALQSPTEGEQRFNWARVVKHEFIHVINLQQTDFNIPHWFTEALAVLNEGYPRPQAWNDLLVRRHADEKLFHLDTINLGFIRPQSSDEWTLAYCQAELYAEYMLERFGEDAVARMLAAYRDNLTTPEAIERAFQVPQADFEQGYRAYVDKIVAALPPNGQAREWNLAEVQRALAEKPDDPELLSRLAYAQLGRRDYAQARRVADQALKADPKCALAHYVRARLHLLVGENAEALARLEGALDRERPQSNVLGLLAGLKLKAEDFPAAAELYALGDKHEPGNPRWLKSLAAVYLKSGDQQKLVAVLERLAQADADDLPIRKKLAQLALAKGDTSAAERWTREALQIDARDVDVHVWRGEAFVAQKKPADAAAEFAVAVELDPEHAAFRLDLAKALLQANQQDQAKAALEALLQREPDHAEAKRLKESLP
ncbi:MAG: tetratricopeptide repeat protein [Pirellulales bacterium]